MPKFVPVNSKRRLCFQEKQGVFVFDLTAERVYWFDGPEVVTPDMQHIAHADDPNLERYFVPVRDRDAVVQKLADEEGLAVTVFKAA